MTPPALELRALTKRYDDGFLALDGVDLVVPDGEFFGLLGPNGAGKTTLISAVCNLIRTTGGEARIFGHPHDDLEARRLIGLAEQDINLDRFLTVEETLIYHGGWFGMSKEDACARAGVVPRHAEVAAVVDERLLDGEEAVEVDVLLGQAHPAAGLKAVGGLAEDGHVPARDADQVADGADQRRLAGAVRAEQAEERALRDRQVEVAHGDGPVVVVLGESADVECGG